MSSILDNEYDAGGPAPTMQERAERELQALEGHAREIPDPAAPPKAADAIQDAAERGGTIMIAKLVKALFDALAPNWHVSEDESSILAQVWVPILDKYLPGWEDNPETLAGFATVGVIGPRFGTPRKAPPIDSTAREVPAGPAPGNPPGWGTGTGGVQPPRPDNG